MSQLWLGHSLAEVGGASGYPYPGCRDLLGTPFGSPTPLVAEKTKNQNVKNGRHSGHFWHFDFLFFKNRHEAVWRLLAWLQVGHRDIYMTHLTWL